MTTNDDVPPFNPLTARFGRMAIPALHLWWRYAWRVFLALFAVLALAVSVALLLGMRIPAHGGAAWPLMMGGAIAGLGLVWLLVILVGVVFGIWLFRATIFRATFLYHGQLCHFQVAHQGTAYTYPLPLEAMVALWWGSIWRTWVVMAATTMLLFFLGPLHLLIQLASGYVGFWWLLAVPYGNTHILVVPV
ncbi:MAG: hypothetical protein ACYCXG_03985 [Acidiferrobacter sp.]